HLRALETEHQPLGTDRASFGHHLLPEPNARARALSTNLHLHDFSTSASGEPSSRSSVRSRTAFAGAIRSCRSRHAHSLSLGPIWTVSPNTPRITTHDPHERGSVQIFARGSQAAPGICLTISFSCHCVWTTSRPSTSSANAISNRFLLICSRSSTSGNPTTGHQRVEHPWVVSR